MTQHVVGVQVTNPVHPSPDYLVIVVVDEILNFSCFGSIPSEFILQSMNTHPTITF